MNHKQSYTVTITGQSAATLTVHITKSTPTMTYSRTNFTVQLCTESGSVLSTATTTVSSSAYVITWSDSWSSSSYRKVKVSDDFNNTYLSASIRNPEYSSVTTTGTAQLEYMVGSLTINDYDYSLYDDGSASVVVNTNSKNNAQFSGIFGSIYDGSTMSFYKLTDMTSCFENCFSLTDPPLIPFGVKYMSSCFKGCAALKYPPKLPSSAIMLDRCFHTCSSMKTSQSYYIIPENVQSVYQMFYYCDADNWISKVVVLSQNITDAGGMFNYINATHEDARGIINNLPSNASFSFFHDNLDYGSELLGSASDSYHSATINVWPVRTTPATGTKLNIESLLAKLVNQVTTISSRVSSIRTFINNFMNPNSNYGRTSSRITYPRKYSSIQALRYRRARITDLTNNYILYYRYWADGFTKVIFYNTVDISATQKCNVNSSGTKYVYNRSSAATTTSSWSIDGTSYENLYVGGLWKYGYIQPVYRGNPMCISGRLVEGTDSTGTTLTCQYQAYTNSNSTQTARHIMCMGLLGTYSIDDFYE